MANKIQHGISELWFYKRNADGTYQAGYHQKGAESFNMANSGNGNFTVWADNGKFHNEAGSSGKEGDLQVAKFDPWYYENVLGQEVDENGGISDNYGAEAGEFGMAFQLEGDKGGRRVFLYGCTGTNPTFTAQTDSDSKTESSETSTVTSSYVDVPETTGKSGSETTVTTKRCMFSCEKGHPLYDTFFTKPPHATISQ